MAVCARRRLRQLHRLGLGARRQLRPLLGGTTACVRVDHDAEALGQLGDPGDLVRRGRDHRAAQALRAALEVDDRPVALEVARPRQDEIGRAAHGSANIVIAITASLAPRATGRAGRRPLVAGDEEHADLLGPAGSPSPAACHAWRPHGRSASREVEGCRHAELLASSATRAPPAPPDARPDQHHALADLLAELRGPPRRGARHGRDRPGGADGDDLGAVRRAP